jgi:type I restriction enzyme R subunit
MDPGLLYEAPFTDYNSTGLDGVFGNDDATGIVCILDSIRRAAVA